MKFRVYRYNPDTDQKPRMVDYEIKAPPGMMLREALLEIKRQDETFAFRHSCGEGVCGSDGMNVNGTNRLACVTLVADLKEPIEVRPFPGRPVIRDLDALTPDWSLLEWDKYIYIPLNCRVAVPNFARGCPFGFRFCSPWKAWRKDRARDPKWFVDEIETLLRDH
jgi:hypothetical protein